MLGPPRKPTRLMILTGNPGKRRINKREPQPAPGGLVCPVSVPREGKELWAQIVPELERIGVATRIDQTALEAYCRAYSTWKYAERKLKQEGMTFTSPTSGIPHTSPYVQISNTAAENVIKWARELGLTPASRSRLQVEIPQPMSEIEKKYFS